MVWTRKGTERVIRYAFETAMKRGSASKAPMLASP